MNDEAKQAGHPNIPEHKKTPAMLFHDKRAKLDAMFGAGAGKFVEDTPARGLLGSIDIVGLDDWFHAHFGNYDADDKTSMRDFIVAKFGEDAAKWVEENMHSVI